MQVNKIKQPIKPIIPIEMEDENFDEDDIQVLDPDSIITPHVVVLNSKWVKVELK